MFVWLIVNVCVRVCVYIVCVCIYYVCVGVFAPAIGARLQIPFSSLNLSQFIIQDAKHLRPVYTPPLFPECYCVYLYVYFCFVCIYVCVYNKLGFTFIHCWSFWSKRARVCIPASSTLSI